MTTDITTVPMTMAADQAKHKAVIELAAKIRDWQTLLFAVEDMIADQRDFVSWWDEHVRSQGEVHKKLQTGNFLSVSEATQLTGIKDWQVSRWRTALADECDYRDRLIEAAQRRAGFFEDEDEDGATGPSRADPPSQRGQPKRLGADFWPTPDSLIKAASEHLLPVLPRSTAIWECACGDGTLGRGIGATILTDKHPQDGSNPLDFITEDPPCDDLIAFTNPPFNAFDLFLKRGLELLDTDQISGLVLLLRHDHFMAGGKAEALNRAKFEVHCNWRPTWIANTVGNPRWAFAWVYWGNGKRQPPLYVKEVP